MARQRMLHPDFFTDPKVVRCSPLARLLFQGMWCLADREGRLEGDTFALKLRLLPADNCDIETLVGELVAASLVVPYVTDDGRSLLWVPGFTKRQRPHPKEPKSALPAPQQSDIAGAIFCRGQPCKNAAKPSESESESESVTTFVESAAADVDRAPELDLGEPLEAPPPNFVAVFEHWRHVMGHPDAKPISKRRRAVAGRLKEGYSVEQLKRAVDGCSRTAHNMGANANHERYDDLELICRNGTQVERFMRNATGPPIEAATPKVLSQAERKNLYEVRPEPR